MKKYEFTIGGNTYNVRVKAVQGSVAHVEVNGSSYDVHLNQEVKTTKTTDSRQVSASSDCSKICGPCEWTEQSNRAATRRDGKGYRQ